MIFVHEVHEAVAGKMDELGELVCTVWRPVVEERQQARLLWFWELAHGTGASYQAVSLTAVRDWAAWGEPAASSAHSAAAGWSRGFATATAGSRSSCVARAGRRASSCSASKCGQDVADEEVEPFPVERRAQREDHPFGAGLRVGADPIDDLGRRPDENPRPDEVGHRPEHEAEVLLLLADGGLAVPDGQPEVHGPRDGPGVPLLALAPAVERGSPIGEDVRREEGRVPPIGVPGHDAKQAAFTLTADPEAEPGLDRPGIAERVGQVQLPPGERHLLAVEEPSEHRGRLLEQIQPLPDGGERDAEGAALDLVPPRADAELATAAAHVVDGHRRLGEHPDRPVADAEHEAADADAARLGGERCHRGDALERGLRRIGEVGHRVDVVPDRAPVKAVVVGHTPQPAEVGDAAVLRARVDAEAHALVYTRSRQAQSLRALVPTR